MKKQAIQKILCIKKLRKYQMIKFNCLDTILQNIEGLLLIAGERKDDHYELPSPIMFELTDPMARFSCIVENRRWVVKSVAETLYAFSGMNGSDFIWEFREWEDPRIMKRHDRLAIGPLLRFWGRKEDLILDYYESNGLRQKSGGFVDQLDEVVKIFKRDKNTRNIILQIATRQNLISIYQAWLYCHDDKLYIMVWSGYLDNQSELIFKYIPIFSFLLQIISDLTGIVMGSVQFMVGCLCADKPCSSSATRNTKYPIVNTSSFRYPSEGLTLRDLDVLMSIMVEFVSRLDKNSIGRANPFEGDDRILFWQDCANVFRVWKAEKLGVKIDTPYFFHPQLRFIYGDGAVV